MTSSASGLLWPGDSVGLSAVLYTKRSCSIPGQGTCQGCGFDPRLGYVQKATEQRFSPFSLSLSLSLSLSVCLSLSLSAPLLCKTNKKNILE